MDAWSPNPGIFLFESHTYMQYIFMYLINNLLSDELQIHLVFQNVTVVTIDANQMGKYFVR